MDPIKQEHEETLALGKNLSRSGTLTRKQRRLVASKTRTIKKQLHKLGVSGERIQAAIDAQR